MNEIIIDDNWKIEKDSYCWVLIFNEEREKSNKEGVVEKYVSQSKWYYPDLKYCLKKYIDASSKKCNSIIELNEHISKMHSTIDNFKNTIFKDGKN